MNISISWHDVDRTLTVFTYIKDFLYLYPNIFKEINIVARKIKSKINEVDSFIQKNTSIVCPECESRCCLNRHGYYDNLDILYITALGFENPPCKEDLSDDDPCQFLSEKGCVMERYMRPFRCNWYFCEPLLRHMEEGPARPYREFIRVFNKIIDLRAELLQLFQLKVAQSLKFHGISR